MAFEVKKIDPLDLQPRKAVGVQLPFSGKSVFNVNYTTEAAIKTNLINYFLTGRGERFLNVNFGKTANACAVSKAGIIPSNFVNSYAASKASLSVAFINVALLLSYKNACNGPTPG